MLNLWYQLYWRKILKRKSDTVQQSNHITTDFGFVIGTALHTHTATERERERVSKWLKLLIFKCFGGPGDIIQSENKFLCSSCRIYYTQCVAVIPFYLVLCANKKEVHRCSLLTLLPILCVCPLKGYIVGVVPLTSMMKNIRKFSTNISLINFSFKMCGCARTRIRTSPLNALRARESMIKIENFLTCSNLIGTLAKYEEALFHFS